MKTSLLPGTKRIYSLKEISRLLLGVVLIVITSSVQAQCDSLNLTYSVNNPTCNGTATGGINVNVSGGAAPYLYAWSNGSVTEDQVGLSASIYTVVVTDQNGCLDTAVITLNQPAPLSDIIQQQNVSCNGGNDGFIITNVSGGVSPYSYFWSNGTQMANAINLTAGVYIVTVVDYLGCSHKDTIDILQPDPISLQLVSPEPVAGYNVSTYLGTDGSIDLTANGGTSPYTYLWSNGSITQDLSGLSAGSYAVTVTDVNHCTVSASIVLDQPNIIEMPSGFSPNNDGFNDNFVVHGAEEYPNNILTIFNRWGNVVYQREGYSNQWNGYNSKGDELPDGTYFAIMEIKSKELVLKGYVELKRH